MRVETERLIEDARIQNQQVQVQFRNHLHHFTEIKKDLGFHNSRLEKLEKEVDTLPKLRETFWQTELYIHKFLPSELIDLVGRGLQESVKLSSSKQRLLIAKFLHDEAQKALNDSRKIEVDQDDPSSINGSTFQKNKLKALTLSPTVHELEFQHEREVQIQKRKDAEYEQAQKNRKTEEELFFERLFRYDIICKLTEQVQAEMDDSQTAKIKDMITGSKEILQLKQHKEKMESLNIERRLNQRAADNSSYGSEDYDSERSSDYSKSESDGEPNQVSSLSDGQAQSSDLEEDPMIKKREQLKSQGTEVTGRGLLSSAGDALLTSEVNSIQSSNAPNFNNQKVGNAIKINDKEDPKNMLKIGMRKHVQDKQHKESSQTRYEDKPRSRGLTTAGSEARRSKRGDKTSSRREKASLTNEEIPERGERKSSRRERNPDEEFSRKPTRRTSGGQSLNFDSIRREVIQLID